MNAIHNAMTSFAPYAIIIFIVVIIAITVVLAVRDSKRKKNGLKPKDTKIIVFFCIAIVLLSIYAVMQFII